MNEILTGLAEIGTKTTEALGASERDDGASPVLVAVVREFAAKADKARQVAAAPQRAAEAVIELEQAGDSAKAAAEADAGAAAATKQAVLDAHLAICKLKASLPTGEDG